MRLAPLYRNALLLTGLLLSGIAAVQAADWPRQITDSRGTHTGKPAAAYCFHQRHPDRLTAGD
ncbi:hypothetical protein ECZU51_10130 [Escherichia coli]|nr:hypothetical protein ECZU51_10130 [Escherichia coli]